MAAPGVLGFGGAAADNGYITGPLVATFAMVAWWECTRVVRWFNVPLAAWLMLSPWVLNYDLWAASISDMVTGLLVMLLSAVKGRITKEYGGGWSSLWGR